MKRKLQIESIEYNERGQLVSLRGSYNNPVDVKPTERFDHCAFLEIDRMGGRDE